MGPFARCLSTEPCNSRRGRQSTVKSSSCVPGHLRTWHQGASTTPGCERSIRRRRDSSVAEIDDGYYFRDHRRWSTILDNAGPALSHAAVLRAVARRRRGPDGLVVGQGSEFSFLDDKPHSALSAVQLGVIPKFHSYLVRNFHPRSSPAGVSWSHRTGSPRTNVGGRVRPVRSRPRLGKPWLGTPDVDFFPGLRRALQGNEFLPFAAWPILD